MVKIEKIREIKTVSVKKFIDELVYRIDLDAEYQRDKIWPQDKQELLLDSIIRDIDIPKIYLAEIKSTQFDYECIDGKQRISTLLRFFKPETNEKNPLMVEVAGRGYTYKNLKHEHPTVAKFIDEYELNISILKKADDKLIRETFRRLQLGIELNPGELLKSMTGNPRNFVFKEIGKDGPFFVRTKISEKRFARELTLSQILINSFSKAKIGEFVRARREDIEDFFESNRDLDTKAENFKRVKLVLEKMDEIFGDNAKKISSRAVALSAYFYVEHLYVNKKNNLLPKFTVFYIKLIDAIKDEMKLLRQYKKPNNAVILDQFQKYIMSASVESYSIKRRQNFLEIAFNEYLKTNKILSKWNINN